MSRSELEGLPEVFIIQLGVLTAQVVPVRIQSDRLKRTPNRDTEITDARLTTEPIRITCYSVEAHCQLFLRSIISKDVTDLNRAAPGTKPQVVNRPHWSTRRRGTGSTELIIEHEDIFSITQLEIPEGGDYPALERIEGRPDLLADILEPRRSSAGTD